MNNIIVVSDTHFGCGLALMPPQVKLDNGQWVEQSPLQVKLWAMWNEFWDEWVPEVTKGEPFILVHNGDLIDGVHHNSTTQISQNKTDQGRIAVEVMRPIIARASRYYHIRGTEAHVGKSASNEEALAQALGAVPDSIGNYARWEMYYRLKGSLIHFSHHIGGTQSAAYESTAVYKEYIEATTESGRWKDEPPDVVVRSHRHRAFEVRVPTAKGYGISVVTPAWQLKTPFVHRLALGRTGQPQIGGILIRTGDEDPIYTRSKVWRIARPEEVTDGPDIDGGIVAGSGELEGEEKPKVDPD